MANVDNPNGFAFAYSETGYVQMASGTVAASQTIAVGDALIVSGVTAGQIAIAASNSGLILGVAAEAVTTAAGATDTIMFYPSNPWLIFEGQCSGTYATTIRYTAVDIEGATSVMEVNEDATTETVVYVIGEVDGTEIGANSRVLFRFIRSSYCPLLAAA